MGGDGANPRQLPAAAFPGIARRSALPSRGTLGRATGTSTANIRASSLPTRDRFAPDSARMADMGNAFQRTQSLDEAAHVGQAQLGTRMQSQLWNMLDDTPRYRNPAAPTPGNRASSVWRAAEMRPEAFPIPGDEYTGPRLEPPDRPITLDWAMQVVRHFQHHVNVPLPARYLCRLLDDAERLMEQREAEGPVWQVELPPEGATREGNAEPLLIVMGDTHGQVEDVLWVFYKMGLPSPTNRYLVNGDICDRGHNAVEIWALFLTFMSLWPESVIIQRGNHEDRLMNMDANCGGFSEEIRRKYDFDNLESHSVIYEKFGRLFARLPLASVVDKRVFVVHGGLSRGVRGFMRLLRTCRVRSAEIPPSLPGASVVDLAYVDAMWSDPQEVPGVSTNSRGPGLIAFGPDVTEKFLEENRLELVVRSHQVPESGEGYHVHHYGKLITVFSASNYCGLTNNYGAVLIFRTDGSCEAISHWAPTYDRIGALIIDPPDDPADKTPAHVLAQRKESRRTTSQEMESLAQETRQQHHAASDRAVRLEKEVIWGMARQVVERKKELLEYWEDCDKNPKSGFIPVKDWEEGMAVVLGDGVAWKTMGKVLHVKDSVAKDVDYRLFLNRFRVAVVGNRAGGDRWLEELLGRFYGRLMALKGYAGSLDELEGFLGRGDGRVSPADALEAFRWVLGSAVSEEQATQMLRTLSAHVAPDPSPVGRSTDVFEFLSRLDVCYQYHHSVERGKLMPDTSPEAGGQKDFSNVSSSTSSAPGSPRAEASPWARSVLAHLGRLLWMEDAGGSPKAGSNRMLQVFRYFDEDSNGLLERAEFEKAVKTMLTEYRAELPDAIARETACDERIRELMDCVDVGGDGSVNYLEFLHAFQPVDRTPGRGLRTDLMEQICTTIWANKASLLRTLQVLEDSACQGSGTAPTGHISAETLKRTLRTLNANLGASRGGSRAPPLTGEQIEILVDHSVVEDGNTIDYRAFLDAFQIVDTAAARHAGDEDLSPMSPTKGDGAAAGRSPPVDSPADRFCPEPRRSSSAGTHTRRRTPRDKPSPELPERHDHATTARAGSTQRSAGARPS